MASKHNECRKVFTSEVRKEISCDLVTLLYTYETVPCAADCKKVAAFLITMYLFMSDGSETGNNKAVIIIHVLCYRLAFHTHYYTHAHMLHYLIFIL